MNRIWPGAIVMENTLQVHVAAVRKALGPYRRQGRCLGHQRVAEPEGAVRGGESRCLPWLCARPQDLRARHIGHVVVNSAADRPWSEYFCCMLIGNRKFVRKYPAATKRVLRAILKAADLCRRAATRARENTHTSQ
jgi:hypothetical protein